MVYMPEKSNLQDELKYLDFQIQETEDRLDALSLLTEESLYDFLVSPVQMELNRLKLNREILLEEM